MESWFDLKFLLEVSYLDKSLFGTYSGKWILNSFCTDILEGFSLLMDLTICCYFWGSKKFHLFYKINGT